MLLILLIFYWRYSSVLYAFGAKNCLIWPWKIGGYIKQETQKLILLHLDYRAQKQQNEKQVIKHRWKLPQDETCSTRAGKLRNYQKVPYNWIRAILPTVVYSFSVKAKVSYFWTFNSDRSRPPINKTLISWPSDLGGVRESTEIDLVSYLRKITALSLIFYCKTVPLRNVALI